MTQDRPPPPIQGKCETCWFWLKTGASQGDCRRYPPVKDVKTLPQTTPESWCGEYRQKTT